MIAWILTYLATGLAFGALDAVWLTQAGPKVYRPLLDPVLADKPALAPAVVYWYGGHRVIDDAATLGTIVASASLLTRLYGPASQLLNLNVTILSSLALFERIFDYLDLEHEIADRPGAVTLDDVRGEVRFEAVSFSYHRDGKRLALEDVSFTIPAGKFAAIIRKVSDHVQLEPTAKLTFEVSDGKRPMALYCASAPRLVAGTFEVSLAARPASCKPRDRWLAEEQAKSSCCGPASTSKCCA